MLMAGWNLKKKLASGVSNPVIDTLYDVAINRGAWGGKILGAGGGGCLMLLAPVESRDDIVEALTKAAAGEGLIGAREIPVALVQSGVETLVNSTGR